MAMIPGGPHLSFTAIHELLTASTYLGVGAEAVLRKWQECCKLGVILRTERNSMHGYLPTVQMASLPSRNYFAVCPLVVLATWCICAKKEH
jgi:hypothetical protein